MSSDFQLRGADDFYRLSKALKAADRTGLRKELNRGLKDATKPLIAETRKAALERLPRRGGLAQRVAKSKQVVQVRTGEKTAGVRIVAGAPGSGAAGADAGVIRHPVFGNRDRFVTQQVAPGWFSHTLAESAPTVLPFLEEAMENVIEQVVRDAS